MKKSLQLQEQRGVLDEKRTGILDAIENRDTKAATDAEMKDLKEIRTQIAALDKQIADAQFLEEEQSSAAQSKAAGTFNIGAPRNRDGEAGEARNINQQFSFRAVIDAVGRGKALDGINAEMVQEGDREARTYGVSAEGTALPSMLMKNPRSVEQRADLGVTTAATAGSLVQATVGEVVEYLTPRTVLRELGATFISGLRDGFDLINQDGLSAAVWEGEITSNDQTNPTVAKTQVRPKRLGAFAVFSKQLMNQGVIDVENWVRRDLGIAVGNALETAAINGSGASNQPTGILNTSGIGDVAGGTNGLVPTWGNLVGLETEINIDNAVMGKRAYLTTPGVNGLLKTVKKDAGSGIFINEAGMVNGYPMTFTSLVPSTLTKGTASAICHAIIFGNWEELYLLNWGGIDLVVNPYSLDTTSQVRVTINSWWDIALRHVQSFAAMKDALLS